MAGMGLSGFAAGHSPECVSFAEQRFELSPPNFDGLDPRPLHVGEPLGLQPGGFWLFVGLGRVPQAGGVDPA
jgi:hypothetical protein